MTRPMSPHTPEPKDCGIGPACCYVHQAAPDLLAALARLTEAVHLYSKDPGWLKSARAEAQAAIRKATAP